MVYTISNQQYLMSRKEYSKSPGTLLFYEHDIKLTAESVECWYYALQGGNMYQLAGPDSIDIQATLDISLC